MQKIFFALIILALFGYYDMSEDKSNIVVLELFTSQGCSSCPPADELLTEVNNKFSNNVIALSYHVDYWNYIGWKDPFSKKTFSDKQRAYSKKFKSSSIYTPQLVINGREHFVGSNKAIMYSKLDYYSKEKNNNNIRISNVKMENKNVNFSFQVNGAITKKHLRVILVIDKKITNVKRGENRNRVIENTNIVAKEFYLDLKTFTGQSIITIPDLVTDEDEISLVLLVENDNLDITGGVKVAL
ncbi:DUF1223 domain-containing protein [uncultured Algibacter sp.]|uniref:DUF1223 domain-containing protein n=1 Tax=uncultured Algibacter sp. TaxID=298659 RepID=UPI00262DB3F2|nr:DUF1223 domain-containing protein [uncultured Algibacter sp.]